MSSRLKTLFALHLMLLMYSISDILSKFAGFAEFPSWQFALLYAGVIAILGIYALGWQQILARLPLTTAYSSRAVVVVWGIIWGALFFGEAITWQKLVGAAMIIAGVVLFSRADSQDLTTNAKALDSATEGVEGVVESIGGIAEAANKVAESANETAEGVEGITDAIGRNPRNANAGNNARGKGGDFL